MNGPSYDHNFGAHCRALTGELSAATAGGAGDNAEVTTPWVSRDGFTSMLFAVFGKAVLQDTETLTVDGLSIEDADDDQGTGAAEYQAITDTLVLTGDTGGTTERGQVEVEVDLGGAKEYVRAKYTPDLSAANTDTATIASAFVLGGAAELPVR